MNLKKADKGTATFIMDTAQKIEGLKQLSDDYFYKPRASPIVLETAKKVNDIVNKLFRSGNIDTMTHKWLKIGLKKPRIPEFYTLTKIHKKIPIDRPIVSGSSGPRKRISSFVDSLSVISMADLEKRLLQASPIQPFLWKRFIDNIFSVEEKGRKFFFFFFLKGRKLPTSLTSQTPSTLQSNSLVKGHPIARFSLTQRFLKDLFSQLSKPLTLG